MEWGELPTVVLVEVYKYLSIRDRLKSSSVCRNWRLPGFQVPLSDHLNLRLLGEGDIPKVRFLTQQFIHKVAHVTLTFDGVTPNCLDFVEEALILMEGNNSLKTLKFRCSDKSLVEAVADTNDTNALIRRKYFTKKVVVPLEKVLRTKNQLETFSFPLIQNLSSSGNTLFNALSDIQKTRSILTLHNLFIASLRSVSAPTLGSNCISPALEFNNKISGFVNLQMLSIEHDALTDDILAKIGIGNLGGGLKRLNLVAGKDNPNVSNHGWSTLVANNPQCKVRLTVTGGLGLVSPSSNLLFPSIPLTHFRTYYCKGMRMTLLNSVVRWNEGSLEHLELIDENYDWMEFLTQESQNYDDLDHFLDPIVYAAWRCQKLHTIKIGVLYCGHSLIGIAKLRASSLLRLEIPKSQIVYHSLKQLNQEVSKALSRPWKPVNDFKKKSMIRCESEVSKRPLVHTLRALQSDEEQIN